MGISQNTITTLMAKNQNIGTYLLTTMATNGFGVLGKYLLGIIVAFSLFNYSLWTYCICESIL